MSWVVFDSYKERLDICATCPKFEAPRCTMCGCYMKIKAAIPFTQCPENRWTQDIEVQSERPEWLEQESK